jgi:nitrous oxidase accessory protein NosD
MSQDAPPPDAPSTTEVPLLAGRYLLLDQLGRGGMGAVYHARDAQLDRHVAVKLLPDGSVRDADAVARFRREAKALARLSHPGIIQAFDSGQDGDKHFLVMEYVEGRSLSKILAEKGSLSPTRAADYAHQAALALHHAHQNGLVHRDVKPSNLLVTPDGNVKLLDLGLARFLQDQVGDASLTREGTGMGTPDYAAPEQFRDAHRADPRADIYSLGCTLYHLIAGQVPFPGSSLSEKVKAHETKEAPPVDEACPDMPGGLTLVVQRMMAKRATDRFQSMAEVAEALAPYVASSSPSFQKIRNSSTWDGSRLATMPAFPRRRSRAPWLVGGAAAALILVAVGVVGLAAGWFRPGGPHVAKNPEAAPADTGETPPTTKTEVAGKNEQPPKPADDPNVLTVSKEEKAGGKYRTVAEALGKIRPHQTLRIVDAGRYRESLVIGGKEHEGIILEAPAGAVLVTAGVAQSLIRLNDVRGVELRDLRLQGGYMCTLVLANGACSDLAIERVNFEPATPGVLFLGMELDDIPQGNDPTRPNVSVKNCTFQKANVGVNIRGVHISDRYGAPSPVYGIAVRDSHFLNCFGGVAIKGEAHKIQIVGNRFRGCLAFGCQFEHLLEGAGDILIANNTAFEGRSSIRVWDDKLRAKGVALRNNLSLGGTYPDAIVMDSDNPASSNGPGDCSEYLEHWTFDHNWREVKLPLKPDNADGWIRPGKQDMRQDEIAGVNRDTQSPDFLRPDKDSRLATEGAGKEDPSLPSYIGAVPPEGVMQWDWDRTWRMPKGAQLLTVSKEPGDGGTYRTINDALKEAKPWATIRVLDKQDYAERLTLDDKSRYEGLCLEAVQGAALVGGPTEPMLAVVDVPNVQVRGLRFRGAEMGGDIPLLVAKGTVPGLLLEELDLFSPAKVGAPGMFLEGITISPTEPPVLVRRCTFCVGFDAVHVAGKVTVCSGVRVEQNVVQALRGIWVGGKVRRVQVTGNRILNCIQSGLQVENLHPTAGQILLANNTVSGGRSGFRLWLGERAADLQAEQVELRNNLLINATLQDMAFLREQGGEQTAGDFRALSRLWRLGYNGRDLSGENESMRLPPEPTDQQFDKPPLVSLKPTDPGFFRPVKDSPLCSKGAGTVDPTLPVYIGAVPPEGVPAWDWDRTWQARMTKTEDK